MFVVKLFRKGKEKPEKWKTWDMEDMGQGRKRTLIELAVQF